MALFVSIVHFMATPNSVKLAPTGEEILEAGRKKCGLGFFCWTIVLATLSFLSDAQAVDKSGDRWLFFSGASIADHNHFFYSGGRYHLSGDADNGGWILEAYAGTGRYSYLTQNVAGGSVDASFSVFEGAIGYGHRWEQGRIIGFVGIHNENHVLAPFDLGNRNHGDETGISGKLDLWVKPTENILLTVYASTTNVFSGYHANAFAGYRIFSNHDFYVGPEIAIGGNNSYQTSHFGIRASGIPLFGFFIAVAGGISQDPDTGSGTYGSFSLWYTAE